MLRKKMIVGLAVLTGAAYSAALAQVAPAPAEEAAAEKAVYGNWQYTCDEGACQIVLSMADPETNERLISWSFVYDPPNDRLSSVVTIPLGVALPTGLGIELSDGRTMSWPFQVCDTQGCRAVAVIDDVTEAALSAQDGVQVKFVPYGSRGATAMPVPMSGFAEAKDKLKAQTAQ